MRRFLVTGIAALVAGGSVAVGMELLRNLPASDAYGVDETTGSVGATGYPRGTLPLSDAQRERIHRAVMPFADAPAAGAHVPELAERLSNDQPLQELPAAIRDEIPLLDGQKFVKLHDRILVVDPASRVVVAMIPRYRLLP